MQLQAGRISSAATPQALTQQALSTTSSRFASIQQLITAIGSATDAKGALDLQARIQSEQGLLQTESTKLGILYQVVQAEELTRKQQARENAIASVGSPCAPWRHCVAVKEKIMKFRPGAWRERFCLGTVVTVESAAVRAPVPNRARSSATHIAGFFLS